MRYRTAITVLDWCFIYRMKNTKEDIHMRKKVLALGLALVMCLSMSMTAFAASSSTSSNSGDSTPQSSQTTQTKVETPKPVQQVVGKTAAGAAIAPKAVTVAIPSADGTVKAITLDKVVESKKAEIANVVSIVAAAPAEQATTNINSILTVPASDFFNATLKALAEIKGTDMVVNNCGTVKTAAVAKDALGNTIASAGKIKNVTENALIMLMSVNADGTIEYVEGIVDPITGAVVGAFKGTPSVITVLVLA